jgi:hypothetical protein
MERVIDAGSEAAVAKNAKAPVTHGTIGAGSKPAETIEQS